MYQFTCECDDGWAGALCDVNLDECASYPCGKGATCVDWVYKYVCICSAGYSGFNCETDVDECLSSPCMNGATCNDSATSSFVPFAYYQCTCPAGFTGYDCETDINECGSSPCQNGSTCTASHDVYSCKCPVGFVGYNCEVDTNECDSRPCLNKGVFIDSKTASQMSVSVAFGVYKCSCGAGYTGFNCETDINECASTPCANGGSCIESGSQDSVGVGSSMALDASKTFVSSLSSKAAAADGTLTADELLKDPEGSALLKALQAQIASQLGVGTSSIIVQNIALNAATGRRLMDGAQRVAKPAGKNVMPPVMAREGYYTVPSLH